MRRDVAKKTGWAPGLMQDDHPLLSKWFASRMDARYIVRQVCREIAQQRNNHATH